MESIHGSISKTSEVCPDVVCEASESGEVSGADAVAEDELREADKVCAVQGRVGVEGCGVEEGELDDDEENKAAGLRLYVSGVQWA